MLKFFLFEFILNSLVEIRREFATGCESEFSKRFIMFFVFRILLGLI
jgi:hypothetical protein